MSTPTIQIFGRKDCSDTRKAERFFKERGVKFQAVDLKIKAMSKGELEAVARKVGWEALLDREGALFKSKGLAFMSPERIPSVVLEEPLLLKTPVVRFGAQATLGFQADTWKQWLGKR